MMENRFVKEKRDGCYGKKIDFLRTNLFRLLILGLLPGPDEFAKLARAFATERGNYSLLEPLLFGEANDHVEPRH
jgi:hypothetical protein